MILFSKAVSSPAMRWIMQAELPLLPEINWLMAYFWLTLGVRSLDLALTSVRPFNLST